MEFNASEIVNSAIQPEQSTETQQEVPTQEAPKEDSFAKKFEILAKMERKNQELKKQFEDERKGWESEKTQAQEALEFKKLFQENPAAALKKLGMGYDDLTKKMMETMDDDDLDPVAKRLRELEAKLEEKESKLEEMLNSKLSEREVQELEKEQNQAREDYKKSVTSFISQNKDKYELMSGEEGIEETVIEIVEEYYKKSLEQNPNAPKILSPEEACDLLEGHLESKLKTVLESSKVKKLMGLVGMEGDEDALAQAKRLVTQDTNSYASNTIDENLVPRTPSNSHNLSEDERVKEAIKLLAQQGM